MDSSAQILLDVPFPVAMRRGGVESLTLPEALSHPDAVSVASGHAYLDLVGINLVVCALQTFMAPPTTAAWKDLLMNPPGAGTIRAAFAHSSASFDLLSPERPFMQVRFEGGLAAQPKAKKRDRDRVDDSAQDDETPESGRMDLALLLPEEASKNQRAPRNSGEHFTKRGRFEAFGGFAAAAMLSGINLLGVGGGGGYFNPDTRGAALVRIALPDGVEHGLWRSAWLNVQSCEHPALVGVPDREAVDELLFGWANPLQRRTRGKSPEDADGIERLARGEVPFADGLARPHPLALLWAVSRRCELGPAEAGICSLTGIEGPVWRDVEIQPGGIRCALLPESWHPLIGIHTHETGKKGPPRSVNRGPSSGVFRAAEWSGLFPAARTGTADAERTGTPPSIAALGHPKRRAALDALLRSRMGGGATNPTFPVVGVALRQEKVLEGWSEGVVRMWGGGPDAIAEIGAVLGDLKAGAIEATAVAKAALEAAEAFAPKARTGKDAAAGFKDAIASWIRGRIEVMHEDLGERALEEVTGIGADASEDADGRLDDLRRLLRANMRAACLEAIRLADYGPLGGLLAREAAVLAAERSSEERRSTSAGDKRETRILDAPPLPPHEEQFARAIADFAFSLERDPALRGRLRRSSAARDALVVPQVHLLARAIGDRSESATGAARVALFLAEGGKDSRESVGAWLLKVWRSGRGSRPSREFLQGCDARLDALLRTPDADTFLRLLRSLMARSEERAPKAGIARAILDWETPGDRKRAASQLARQYASARIGRP